MSDGATSEIDPRFDPRYQRGYTGLGPIDGTADAAAPPVPTVTRVPEPPAREPFTEPTVPTDAPSGAPLGTRAPVLRDADPAADGMAELVGDFGAAEPEPEPDPLAPAFRPWLIAAWALLGAFVVVGTSLIWTMNNDVNLYTGMGRNSAFRDLSWMAAPALVKVGLLGTVALLAALTLRRILAAPASTRLTAEVKGYPAFLGLLGVIGAAVVLVAWYTAIAADGRVNSWSGEPDAELVGLMALQQTVSILTSAAVEAALWASLVLLALAALSAVRARSARPDRP